MKSIQVVMTMHGWRICVSLTRHELGLLVTSSLPNRGQYDTVVSRGLFAVPTRLGGAMVFNAVRAADSVHVEVRGKQFRLPDGLNVPTLLSVEPLPETVRGKHATCDYCGRKVA